MNDSDLLLGVDVGTTGTKAALFNPEGELIALGEAEYSCKYLPGNRVEQNPEDWWGATCTAIKTALAKIKQDADRIRALGVSSQAPTLLAVDEIGQPLRPALIWMDRRAGMEADEIAQQFGFSEIVNHTGNRPDPYFVAAKLRWLSKHEPEIVKKAHRFLQVTGFINHRLTGEWTLDLAHSGLLQLRDISQQGWWPEILAACGITDEAFPCIHSGEEIIGEVCGEAAEATGLKRGTPVVAGTVDGAAAALEAGALDPGTAAEMTGTSTVLMIPTSSPQPNEAFICMPHAVAQHSLTLAAMVSSGASLKWFRDNCTLSETARAEGTAGDTYEKLTELATNSNPGANGLTFLPYMMGERSPLWHTEDRGVFFGLSLSTIKGDLVRAILEGAAFALRHNVEVAAESGLRVDSIRSVGGGARSELWCQIKADVLGIPIELPQTSVGAPFGNAVLAGLGIGLYSDASTVLSETVKIARTFEPDVRRHDHYSEHYRIFRCLYECLKTRFDEAARLT